MPKDKDTIAKSKQDRWGSSGNNKNKKPRKDKYKSKRKGK